MGFYLRKSIKVGPFRFNLSNSGLGLSVGVKGLRVGTGPRGNYVHMGRGGLYFRTALPSTATHTLSPLDAKPIPAVGGAGATLEVFQDIESAETIQLSDASSSEIVDQVTSKARVPRLLPWAICVAIAVVGLLVYNEARLSVLLVAALVVISIVILARQRDIVSRSVVLMYSLDDHASKAYEQLYDAFDSIRSSERTWHVNSSANVLDGKYHAGASSVVNRAAISLRKGDPPILRTNVEALLLPAGRQLLAFMPDRLLIFEHASVAGILYKNLALEVRQTRFIEDKRPPAEAKIVGTTWRYVNKKGGPDRRFANNPQLPIALYEELHFRSETGLNELFQCSRLDVGKALGLALQNLASIAIEGQASQTYDTPPPAALPST